jgi:RHS repeat-associated protein
MQARRRTDQESRPLSQRSQSLARHTLLRRPQRTRGLASHTYDAIGRQAIRTVTSPAPVTIHSVFDSDGRRIAEYNETSGGLIREYVWNGWDPVAVIEGGVISFVRADHIGRPVFATNAAGVKVWTATYQPFGGVHVSTGTPPPNRFPGQWFQSESGLHQNWMRDYDPTTGRYLQADPLGLIDGASVYGYVRQSPMMYTDPTGECPWCVFGAIVALGMLYDYLSDDCYTWMDFWYSLASNINPLDCRKVPVLCMIRKGVGGGRGSGGSAGPADDPPIFASDIDTALDGAVPQPNTRGPSDVHEKPGGYESALEDFHNMTDPSSVSPLAPGKDGYKGKTPDGNNISVRPDSSGGQPTVQVEIGDGTRVKIRY